MSGYEVGQRVVIVDNLRWRGLTEREGTVTKVARKYATVQDGDYAWSATQYDMATGYEKSGQFMPNSRIYTTEAWAEHCERRELLTQLLEATRSPSWRDQLTTEQLRAVVAALVSPKNVRHVAGVIDARGHVPTREQLGCAADTETGEADTP